MRQVELAEEIDSLQWTVVPTCYKEEEFLDLMDAQLGSYGLEVLWRVSEQGTYMLSIHEGRAAKTEEPMESKRALRVAAQILAGEGGDEGLLNAKLCQEIEEVFAMCRRVKSDLRSRQVIASIIWIWQKLNPNEKSYGE